jgi:hypothetical protein
LKDYQSLYYVYIHQCPVTGHILYIGHGTGARAWNYREYSSRSVEHEAYLTKLFSDGFLPTDWVTIYAKGMSKPLAIQLEFDLIKLHNPKFNKTHKPSYKASNKISKTGVDICRFAYMLHNMGYGYRRIAFLMGASIPKNKVMSIKRNIKAYEELM